MCHQRRRGIVHAKCRFLQSCSNIWRMTCFWWQLTPHHGSHHKAALEERLFWDQCEKIPTFAGCHLATHSKSWFCGSRGLGLLEILLPVLGTSKYPSGLCPEEVALLVSLDGEHPSSGHIVLLFGLPHVNEIKNLIVNPGFVLKMFASANCL